MPDPFVHLHVASGYSLQYGASHPQTLVERAAEYEMDTLALTDRNGTYGAVKFVQAARMLGVRPILGVDLAYDFGSVVSTDRPATRVTLLADGKAGWAALSRLTSAAHLQGERGKPLLRPTPDVLEQLATGHLLVLLGPESALGAAVTQRRDDWCQAAIAPWQEVCGREQLLVELVAHRVPPVRGVWGPGSVGHAARMLGTAQRLGLGCVSTNAVRYADRRDAPIVDVLDASRRLVALDERHVDRRNAEGFLKSGKQMAEVATDICRAAGIHRDEREAQLLLAHTRATADRCALDPRADLGIGTVHLPEVSTETLGHRGGNADGVLRARCVAGINRRYPDSPHKAERRLDHELDLIARLGFASYFITVADISDLIKSMGIRAAARGSGAGSLVNYLLGVSGVDPLEHRLLMERFLSDRRTALPDIDIDVESARRLEVYDAIVDRYSGERCAAVSMMETYRVRHACRDVGKALGMPPGEIDAIAKSFPHIRARDARMAMRDLPELRNSALVHDESGQAAELFFGLVERLDGLPRHIAMHPCGVVLSDLTLLDRTPVESSFLGYPMSHFDKDDVEEMGLLKLDVLGIRMQSAMAHAVDQIHATDNVEIDLDDACDVPMDDPATFDLISAARTLGVFQIESPGQRELVGKSGLSSFADIITDISLFRPGPVKSDMITPYLNVRHGWETARYLHDDLRPALEQTEGVVVFHEQVIEIIAVCAGVTFAEADEVRRKLGSPDGMAEMKTWFFPRALGRRYPLTVVEQIWSVLEAFASFGFCKAHAAAFALPTYQSAWLKTHWPAHFLAGVLTHDPGMYPKRLILDDARQFGIGVRGPDINASAQTYTVEPSADPGGYAIRVGLADVKGISGAEIERIVGARPYSSLSDLWHRARPSRPVLERLVLVGALDQVARVGPYAAWSQPRTRRDLLLHIAELDRHSRALDPAQLALDLGDAPDESLRSGLPEMNQLEQVQAELEIIGLDASSHVMTSYHPLLRALGVVPSKELLAQRSGSEIYAAGVKVATQTPPIRSGKRVIFVTVDDSTGPVDATFFDQMQGEYAATVFDSWLLLLRGVVRRTGRRGISLRATGAWALPDIESLWQRAGTSTVFDLLDASRARTEDERMGRTLVHSSGFKLSPYADIKTAGDDVRQGAGQVARNLWHRSPGSRG